jgi:uncharacterized membrane protein SpoIIM required for sporulation
MEGGLPNKRITLLFTQTQAKQMKNKFWIFGILSFSFWLLPFAVRLFFVDMPEVNIGIPGNQTTEKHNAISETIQLLHDNDRFGTFVVIFSNNLKGCILNIVGGVTLGLGTLLNLLYNGFFSADMFKSANDTGLILSDILKTTLPHSFVCMDSVNY